VSINSTRENFVHDIDIDAFDRHAEQLAIVHLCGDGSVAVSANSCGDRDPRAQKLYQHFAGADNSHDVALIEHSIGGRLLDDAVGATDAQDED
jgi:hypothetical protein